MSNTTLIIGESGAGKSSSLRNLDPSETYIINVLDKPLPFRGYKKNYWRSTKENPNGNYFPSDEAHKIIGCIKAVNDKPHIKNLIIDDFQYIMANEFMRRALERGYDKFSDIAKQAWAIIKELTLTRPDLFCFVLSHSEIDITGKVKCKTIGKMLDDKITLEGMFTVVLHAQVIDGQYKFLTQNNGMFMAKSPLGMFDESLIDNDLQIVRDKMTQYFEEE